MIGLNFCVFIQLLLFRNNHTSLPRNVQIRMFVPQQSTPYHFERGYSPKAMSRFPSGEVNHPLGFLPAAGQERGL